ncbi:FMN-binding negative transcriptional regulator [Mucilaginibacter sp. dw_454]|uniref:FMN-binding negative transcriptional regulator n=1 Tax=Mucilaginibacter sp. dw_454 TaxID=2720079 RepID=UPI001BD2C615|nr:FMN-binding negative transcriptional regulator [Mucilaginibacter sp. dw_454]
MYTPKINLLDDKQEAVSFMQHYSFATIVTVKNGIPSATHLPFVVSLRDEQIILTSHFAKINPQVKELLDGNPLVIFTEPHAYISPKHYESERSVPTWNYISVHAYGKATLIESAEEKAKLLEQTIRFYEDDYLKQWNGLSEDYKLKMMKGITGFEIIVTELQGKKKLSQNRSDIEKERIIADLSASQDWAAKAIADYMSK